jgi:hypothetical protein
MVDDSRTPKQPDIALTRRLADSSQKFLDKLHSDQPAERLYAFALNISPLAEYAYASAITEEALERWALSFAKAMCISLDSEEHKDALRCALRWSGPEDGWYVQCEEDVSQIQNWFAEARETGEVNQEEWGVLTMCRDVLKELDRRGCFGEGKSRENTIVGVWDHLQTESFFANWAWTLNPPAVADRLNRELDQMHATWGWWNKPSEEEHRD